MAWRWSVCGTAEVVWKPRFLWQWPSAHLYFLVSCFSFSSWQYPIYGAFPLHGTAWYGSVRFTFGGFSTGYCTWYLALFSTTSAEVPSDPYRYQNVTCKLCWSLIGRRESSLLRHWTCDMRPIDLLDLNQHSQPAKERTQLLFQQTHLFASTTNYLFHCLLRKFRRSSRW